MIPPRRELFDWAEEAYPGARLESIAGDASTRRFFRLSPEDSSPLVVMDYGEPFEGATDDVRLTAVFRDADLPVPEIVAVAPTPGCLVLEDLGREMLEGRIEADPSAARDWLERGVDLAVRVADAGSAALDRSAGADGPALDSGRFRFEMDFFLVHYVSGYLSRTLDPDLARSLHALADQAAEGPRRVLCHRDYHSRNLLVRADGTLAMVDIQDARWGPDTYDLASLLFDAYVDVEEEWRPGLVERYRQGLAAPPQAGAFSRRLERVAAERMIKALGTFGYQAGALGRRRYEDGIPRTVRRLRRLLPRLEDMGGLAEELETKVFRGTDGRSTPK